MIFPDNVPGVGGKTFEKVAKDPEFSEFCDFVLNTIRNPTGLFLKFRKFLRELKIKDHGNNESVEAS